MTQQDEDRKELNHTIAPVFFTDHYYGDMFSSGKDRNSLIDVILAAGYRKAQEGS